MIKLFMGPVNSGKSEAAVNYARRIYGLPCRIFDLREVSFDEVFNKIKSMKHIEPDYNFVLIIKEAWLLTLEQCKTLRGHLALNWHVHGIILEGIDYLHNKKPTILETEIKYLVDSVKYCSVLCECGEENTRYSVKIKGDLSVDIEHEPEDSNEVYKGVCPTCYDKACKELLDVRTYFNY